MDIKNYFDAVVVVNLARRPERLAEFNRQLEAQEWPFLPPQVFEAVDGGAVPTPSNWTEGGGAYGCLRSHHRILESSILAGVSRLLVLEDDLVLCEDFATKVTQFLQTVPDDWEQIMFGGQHMQYPEDLRIPGVVRCFNCQRTHAYAVRGRMLKDLYRKWAEATDGHCDWIMGAMQAGYRVYAPDPFLCGQDGGKSDIRGIVQPVRFWDGSDSDIREHPVVLLRCPVSILPALRMCGFHGGYNRSEDTDIDNGLKEIFDSNSPPNSTAMRMWVGVVQSEVQGNGTGITTVYHPKATVEFLETSLREPPILIEADTVEGVVAALPEKFHGNLKYKVPPPLTIVLLDASKEVVDQLRKLNWHTGYSRDSTTGYDTGLIRIMSGATGDIPAKLTAWVELICHESSGIRNGVAVAWHPELTGDLLRRAGVGNVIDIKASTPMEAVYQYSISTKGK